MRNIRDVTHFRVCSCDFVDPKRRTSKPRLERSETLLARSQEEPTYLIELTSEIPESSRLIQRTNGLCCPGANFLSGANHAVQPFLRLRVAWVALLFSAKRRRVVVTAAVDDPGRMLNVQHLVKHDVVDEPF